MCTTELGTCAKLNVEGWCLLLRKLCSVALECVPHLCGPSHCRFRAYRVIFGGTMISPVHAFFRVFWGYLFTFFSRRSNRCRPLSEVDVLSSTASCPCTVQRRLTSVLQRSSKGRTKPSAYTPSVSKTTIKACTCLINRGEIHS